MGKLSDHILQAEKLKIDHGVSTRSGETMEERHESQILHISCGQGKAFEVLKQQTREIDKEIKRKRLVDKQKQ